MDLVALSADSNIVHIIKESIGESRWTFCGRYFLRQDAVPFADELLVGKRVCLYCLRSQHRIRNQVKQVEEE